MYGTRDSKRDANCTALRSLSESAGTGLPCTATLWSRKTEHLASAELASEPIHPARARDLAGRSARHSLERLVARLQSYARSLSRSRTIR
jgi:hypothetical protein